MPDVALAHCANQKHVAAAAHGDPARFRESSLAREGDVGLVREGVDTSTFSALDRHPLRLAAHIKLGRLPRWLGRMTGKAHAQN